jgi:hypothetical protein
MIVAGIAGVILLVVWTLGNKINNALTSVANAMP